MEQLTQSTCANNATIKKESYKFFPLAAIVTEEGGAAHTINLRKPCCNEQESYKFFPHAAIVTEEGGAARTMNLCKQCHHEKESYKFFPLAAIVTEESGAACANNAAMKKRATSSSHLRLL